ILLPQPSIAQLTTAETDATIGLLHANQPATTTGQSATLLPSGRWLLLGGEGTSHEASAMAILVDLASGLRTVVASSMTAARSGHTATVLPDGSVLILGGVGPDGHIVAVSEIF